jgi:hypothetical protein
MRSTKRCLIACLVLLLLIGFSSCGKPEEWIVGKWTLQKALNVDGSPLLGRNSGEWYEFKEDHSAAYRSGDTVRGEWKKSGGSFLFIESNGEKTKIIPKGDNVILVKIPVMDYTMKAYYERR